MAFSSLGRAMERARGRELQRVAELQTKAQEEAAALEAKRKELAEAGTPFISTDKLGDLVFEDDSFYTDYTIDGQVVGKDFVFYDPMMSTAAKASNQVVRYTGGVVPEYRYTFIPENIIDKGFKTDDKQYYLGNILAGDNLDALSQTGVYVDLAGVKDFDKQFKDQGISTKGFLIPYAETEQRDLFSNIKNYDIGKASEDNTIKWGEIKGLSKSGDQYIYATDATPIGGVDQATGYINAEGLQGNWYKKPSGGGFLGDLGRAIADVPFGAELLGLATLNPYVYAAASGLRGGGTGQDPLKVGLQTGLTAGLATELLGGAGTPQGTPGAVGGTPGVSEVFPVAPPNIGVSPLAPLPAGAGAGLGAGAGMLGSGLTTTPAAAGAGMGGLGTGITAGAGGTAAGMGGGSGLLTGIGAVDLLTGATIPAAAAGGALSLEALGNLFPTGLGVAGGGSMLEDLISGAKDAKSLFDTLTGGSVGNTLGTLINAGIDYETASRIAEQARAEGRSVIEQAQELGRQGQLPQSVLDNLNTLAATTAQQFREAGAAAQVPFTPYTVRTGAGTATMGPGEATATAAQPYAQIQQQAQQQALQALGAINPAQASQTLFGQMQALTQPVQQRQQQQLLGTLGQRGLLGFGQNMPTVGGATRTVNPLLESLLSAQGAERAQQALQATQFGTTEAQRQAALSQALTAQAQGIDQQTLGLLGQAGQMGLAEQALAQANAARQLQATTTGLGLPLSTAAATAGIQQRGLEFGAGAGLQGLQAALPLQLQAGLIEAGRTQNLSDLYRSAVNEIFG